MSVDVSNPVSPVADLEPATAPTSPRKPWIDPVLTFECLFEETEAHKALVNPAEFSATYGATS